MKNYIKTIAERFGALQNSKTMQEIAVNEELLQLQMELQHTQFKLKVAEDSVEFYKKLSNVNERLDAIIIQQSSEELKEANWLINHWKYIADTYQSISTNYKNQN